MRVDDDGLRLGLGLEVAAAVRVALQERFDGGLTVTTGDAVGAQDLLTQLGPVPVLSGLLDRLEPDGVGEGPTAVGVAASVLEFALEGLYLNRRLAKDSDGARTIYGA